MTVAPSFDPFAPGSGAAMVLLALRVGGLLAIAPVFSARVVPVRVRTGLLLIVTLLLQPAALGAANIATLSVTPAAAIRETMIGFALGLGAALFVGAAELAGDVMTTQMGLNGAAILDPLNGGQSQVLGHFMQVFAVTMLLASNGHLVMLDALAESTRYIPVGMPIDFEAGVRALLSLGGILFSLGLKFAAPVIAIVLLANVALAVLGRAAPQLNVLSVAFPVQIGIGLFTLAAALPLIATTMTGWEGGYDSALTVVLQAFRGGAR